MPFTPNSQCNICKLIKKGDKQLQARINRSKAFVPGGEPLTKIAADPEYSDKFIYKSLYTHTKRHQAPNQATLTKQLKAKETAEAYKEIQTQVKRRKIGVYENQSTTRAELIDDLLAKAKNGEIRWTGGNLVALLGQAQKEEENAKDRQFGLEKMMYHFIGQGGNPRDYLAYANIEEGELVDSDRASD